MKRSLNLAVPEAGLVKYQALWYSTFVSIYAWYLYWIARDILLWHKPLAQVSVLNYVGCCASIAFILAGTKILKKKNPVEPVKKQRTQLVQQPLPPKQLQKIMTTQSTQTTTNNSACSHYLGYLHERQKSQEIPTECLTCKKVIECFSYTK
jgi:hypothetical protein